MTIEFKTGNILDFTETICVQQVNYKKVMGGGLALQIRNKWPEIYDAYCNFIDENSWDDIVKYGLFHFYNIDGKQFIVNIFGQKDLGRNRCYTDYTSLYNSLLRLSGISISESNPVSIAIPYRIGAGRGGGDWEGRIYPMIVKIFEKSNTKVVIYKLEGVE